MTLGIALLKEWLSYLKTYFFGGTEQKCWSKGCFPQVQLAATIDVQEQCLAQVWHKSGAILFGGAQVSAWPLSGPRRSRSPVLPANLVQEWRKILLKVRHVFGGCTRKRHKYEQYRDPCRRERWRVNHTPCWSRSRGASLSQHVFCFLNLAQVWFRRLPVDTQTFDQHSYIYMY